MWVWTAVCIYILPMTAWICCSFSHITGKGSSGPVSAPSICCVWYCTLPITTKTVVLLLWYIKQKQDIQKSSCKTSFHPRLLFFFFVWLEPSHILHRPNRSMTSLMINLVTTCHDHLKEKWKRENAQRGQGCCRRTKHHRQTNEIRLCFILQDTPAFFPHQCNRPSLVIVLLE